MTLRFAVLVACALVATSCHYCAGTPCSTDAECGDAARCNPAFGVCDDVDAVGEGEGAVGEGEGAVGEGEGVVGEGEGAVGEGEGAVGEGEGVVGEGEGAVGEGEGGEGEGGEGEGAAAFDVVYVDNNAGEAVTDVPVRMRLATTPTEPLVVTDCLGTVLSDVEHPAGTNEYWARLSLVGRTDNPFCVESASTPPLPLQWQSYAYVEHCTSALNDSTGNTTRIAAAFTVAPAAGGGTKCTFAINGTAVDQALVENTPFALAMGNTTMFVSAFYRVPTSCDLSGTQGVLSRMRRDDTPAAGDWSFSVVGACDMQFTAGNNNGVADFGSYVDGAPHLFSLSVSGDQKSVYVDGSLSSQTGVIGGVQGTVEASSSGYVGAVGLFPAAGENDHVFDEIMFSSQAHSAQEVRALARSLLDSDLVSTAPSAAYALAGHVSGDVGAFNIDGSDAVAASSPNSIAIDVLPGAPRVAMEMIGEQWSLAAIGVDPGGLLSTPVFSIVRNADDVTVSAGSAVMVASFSAPPGALTNVAVEIVVVGTQAFVWTEPPLDFADDATGQPLAARAVVENGTLVRTLNVRASETGAGIKAVRTR